MHGIGGFGALSIGHDAGNSEVNSVSSGFGGSTFVGYESAHVIDDITTDNSIFGYWAGYSLDIGNQNNIFGYRAGQHLTDGNRNVIIGTDAAKSASPGLLEHGDENVFIGTESQNTVMPKGSRNVVLGATTTITASDSANNSVLVGYWARGNDAVGLSNPNYLTFAGAIGSHTKTECDSCLVIGARGIHRVGIGRAQPASNTMLDVHPTSVMAWAAIF